MNNLNTDTKEITNQSLQRTKRLMNDSLDGLRQKTGNKYQKYSHQLKSKVIEKPIQSLLIATTIGALITFMSTKKSSSQEKIMNATHLT